MPDVRSFFHVQTDRPLRCRRMHDACYQEVLVLDCPNHSQILQPWDKVPTTTYSLQILCLLFCLCILSSAYYICPHNTNITTLPQPWLLLTLVSMATSVLAAMVWRVVAAALTLAMMGARKISAPTAGAPCVMAAALARSTITGRSCHPESKSSFSAKGTSVRMALSVSRDLSASGHRRRILI